MRQSRIADLVDGFYSRVGSSVEPYCIVSAGDIVVDSSGKTYRRHLELLVELVQAGKRAIATDGDQAVDAMLLQIFERSGPTFLCFEFFASGCLENRATPLNDVP